MPHNVCGIEFVESYANKLLFWTPQFSIYGRSNLIVDVMVHESLAKSIW